MKTTKATETETVEATNYGRRAGDEVDAVWRRNIARYFPTLEEQLTQEVAAMFAAAAADPECNPPESWVLDDDQFVFVQVSR